MVRAFFIRLRNWEYWPLPVVYIPVYIYYLYLALRSRSFFFFTASNPGIENGGMLGESKFPLFERLKKSPKTLLFDPSDSADAILEKVTAEGLDFPLIGKPNIGERGWGVKKLENREDLEKYLDWVEVKFLIQDFVDLPLEAGVFYHRFPGEESGKITSLSFKEMLAVEGDGISTLRDLINVRSRAYLQRKRLELTYSERMDQIIPKGEKVELVNIGNHALGTKFIDATDLIDREMVLSFNKIADDFEGFYFGRFDLRCQSLSDLKKGNVMIMELNGAGAEPAHIYEPGYSLLKGWKVLLKHMKIMWQISRENHRLGVEYMDFKSGWEIVKSIREYNSTYKKDLDPE